MIEDPAMAYKEARRMLKDRFGHIAILETDLENRLANCMAKNWKQRCPRTTGFQRLPTASQDRKSVHSQPKNV